MDFKDFSQLLINKFSFSPTEDQIAAIGELSKFLISNNDIGLFILKGYAGTGKTTLMKTLVDNVKFLKYNICLMAPTGRAAKVLSNYSKKKSFTVHKKIYFSSVDKFGKFETKLKINKIVYTNTKKRANPDLNNNTYQNEKNEILESVNLKMNTVNENLSLIHI